MTPGVSSASIAAQAAGMGAPLARHRRLRSLMPDEIREHMSRVFSPHELSLAGDPAKLAFVHHQVDLERISFNFIDYGEPDAWVSVRVPIQRYVLVQFSLAGSCQVSESGQPHDLPAGHFIVLHPDRPLLVSSRPASST
jgi:AraC-binding-like domain